jgi:hypothetical protein
MAADNTAKKQRDAEGFIRLNARSASAGGS